MTTVSRKLYVPLCHNHYGVYWTLFLYNKSAVVIGFADSSVMVTEGASQSVCAEVQSIGLQLDPFDNVPLSINADNGIYEGNTS